MEKTLYFVDRVFFDREDNRIVGDMGFTFCDMAETRTDNLAELRDSITSAENIADDMAMMEEDGEEDVAIYLLQSNTFVDDVDDEEDWDNFCANEMVGKERETILVVVYTSEAEAKEIGIERDIKGLYPKAEIFYAK